MPEAEKETWWVIEEGELLKALRAAGQPDADPDVIMMELVANTEKDDAE